MLLMLVHSRRIDLDKPTDGVSWLLLCMDSPDNMTYLRMMVWKKRNKLSDLERNQAGLRDVINNVDTPLSELGFQGSYESVCSNKALLGIVAAQMVFELQNENLSEDWVPPFSDSDRHHVELLGLMGGNVVVVSRSGASEVRLGGFGTTTADAVENALRSTPAQGQVRCCASLVCAVAKCVNSLAVHTHKRKPHMCTVLRVCMRVCAGEIDALPRRMVPPATRRLAWRGSARQPVRLRVPVE
jgi:hypothetical protein